MTKRDKAYRNLMEQVSKPAHAHGCRFCGGTHDSYSCPNVTFHDGEDEDQPFDKKVYGVWCRVSGGVTGTREAWLKSNGEIKKFASLEDAQAEASRLNKEMNHSRSVADFRYDARAFDGWK